MPDASNRNKSSNQHQHHQQHQQQSALAASLARQRFSSVRSSSDPAACMKLALEVSQEELFVVCFALAMPAIFVGLTACCGYECTFKYEMTPERQKWR